MHRKLCRNAKIINCSTFIITQHQFVWARNHTYKSGLRCFRQRRCNSADTRENMVHCFYMSQTILKPAFVLPIKGSLHSRQWPSVNEEHVAADSASMCLNWQFHTWPLLQTSGWLKNNLAGHIHKEVMSSRLPSLSGACALDSNRV